MFEISREWQVFLKLQTWIWLGGGLVVTLKIAAVVVAFSLITGTIMALGRLSKYPLFHYPAVFYIDTIRSIPVFLIIMYTFFGLPRVGLEVSVAWSVTIALTIYATALIAEIVRAGLLAVPRGQLDAARSLGLTRWQAFRYIVAPQAFRIMMPPLVGQYIILIKSTSIGAVVGLDELLRRGIILYNGFQNPMQVLIVVACFYIGFLYPLSVLSRRLELREGTFGARSDTGESFLARLRSLKPRLIAAVPTDKPS